MAAMEDATPPPSHPGLVTTSPAPPPPSAADPQYTTELTDEQAAAVQDFLATTGSTDEDEARAFLQSREWDVKGATAQWEARAAWRGELGEVTIAHVAPFLRTPPGREPGQGGAPDGCIVCLEDGRGGCARDVHGRPILASIGMSFGSELEMKQQARRGGRGGAGQAAAVAATANANVNATATNPSDVLALPSPSPPPSRWPTRWTVRRCTGFQATRPTTHAP